MTPSNAIFVAGFVAYFVIRGVWEKRTRGAETVETRFDGRERILLAIVALGTLVLPVLYLATPWLAFADYERPAAVGIAGTVVMALALALFWRSHADLGSNWSISLEIRKGHRVVTTGVYRTIRHPMYAAIFLFSIAQGLLLANWLAGWSAVATFAPLYFIRTPREEKMMRERFGEEYAEYASRTGRLFPRLSRARPPRVEAR